ADVSQDASVASMQSMFEKYQVSAVMHFAAKKQVAESVARPGWYYRQNILGLANVLDACVSSAVKDFVFSSSAAVYGSPDEPIVDEGTPCFPINPYGETKLAGEWLVADFAGAHGLRTTALRYFNVAGTASTA